MKSEDLIDKAVQSIKEQEYPISGPFETEYGFGWSLTTSFWKEKKRVHLYWDITQDSLPLVLEASDLNIKNSEKVKRLNPQTEEDIVNVIKLFLSENKSFEEIDYKWEEKEHNYDDCILDPPDDGCET